MRFDSGGVSDYLTAVLSVPGRKYPPIHKLYALADHRAGSEKTCVLLHGARPISLFRKDSYLAKTILWFYFQFA
jgi:hypothetical protein